MHSKEWGAGRLSWPRSLFSRGSLRCSSSCTKIALGLWTLLWAEETLKLFGGCGSWWCQFVTWESSRVRKEPVFLALQTQKARALSQDHTGTGECNREKQNSSLPAAPLFTLILMMFWVPLTILKQDNVDSGAYCEEELPSYMVKFSFPSQVWWTSIKLIPKARIKVQITKNLFSHFFSAFTLGPKKGWTLVCWLFLEKA